MIVLLIDGWLESKGVQAEMRIARERDIPIYYLKPGGKPTELP